MTDRDTEPDLNDPDVGRAFNAITALQLGLVFSKRARLAQMMVDYAREHASPDLDTLRARAEAENAKLRGSDGCLWVSDELARRIHALDARVRAARAQLAWWQAWADTLPEPHDAMDAILGELEERLRGSTAAETFSRCPHHLNGRRCLLVDGHGEGHTA